jgi:peptide-methionine (S)-S-oxide reductase
MKNKIILLSIFLSFQSCFGKEKKIKNYIDESQSKNLTQYQNNKRAYFASGCFWCVEAIFESIKGVEEVYSGYSGGNTPNPTYNKIGTGRTGHAEAVEVIYDPSIVSYETLVDVFFGSHDPTTLNRQGPDRGTQYRSIAFYKNSKEKIIIEKQIQKLQQNKIFKNSIVTEVKKLEKFFYAEDYHQDYEKLNPNNSYVRNVSIPRLKKFKAKFSRLLKYNH